VTPGHAMSICLRPSRRSTPSRHSRSILEVLSDLLPGLVNRPPDLGEKLRRPTGLREGPGKVTLPPGFDRWLPT
jgi:hypothetical protein